MKRMRLLPWAGEGGQPALLSTENGGSFVSRLADGLECAQLEMAADLLRRVEAIEREEPVSDAVLAGSVPHLCAALRNALRVAESRGERLPGREEDDWSAAADAVMPGGIAAGLVVRRWRPALECAGEARRLLRQYLRMWGVAGLADTTELVLSELFTNALCHASTSEGLVETRFERLASGVRIEVHDASEHKPERRDVSAEAESGRGLSLVDVLTGGQWGVNDREGVGKVVWAVCADHGTEAPRTPRAGIDREVALSSGRGPAAPGDHRL